jgi:hypothetical protein
MISEGYGADPAFVASQSSQQAVSTKGFNPGEGAWVEALCIFYERDCLPQKAWNIRHGAPLDHVDRRAIEALKAAFERIG